MKTKLQKRFPAAVAFIICLTFGAALAFYAIPMEDISLDLSLVNKSEHIFTQQSDEKGWTVYTCENAAKTLLTPTGSGAYTGSEPGQTLYFSRVMKEDLNSPTLQIGTSERNFSVFLDDTLLYTDCPELDNRIGYLKLPMNEQLRTDPIIVSLPPDYQGKTLTIAQSTPEYTEGSRFMVFPSSVMLYCGYAYESGLIAESFQTAIFSTCLFLTGLLLLLFFVHNNDISMLCMSFAAFLWMTYHLLQTSFFVKYFGYFFPDASDAILLLTALVLLIFLTAQADRFQKSLRIITGLYGASLVLSTTLATVAPKSLNLLTRFCRDTLPEWLACLGFFSILLLSSLFLRKDNLFYRWFTPLTLIVMAVYWVILLPTSPNVRLQIVVALKDGHISHIYYRTLTLIMITTLFTAMVTALKSHMERRMEKRLLEERREMSLAGYENLRRQHEEVMMIRHDMGRHFLTLLEMSGEESVKAYLTELIGQNQAVHPVIQCKNQILDIILNSRLNTAADAGVTLEVTRLEAPEQLPLSDADLSSLLMNILDNAITAAGKSSMENPLVKLDIHIKNNYLAIVCENSADMSKPEKESKKETVPRHGLGLKIIRGIAERYKGMLDTEHNELHYKLRVIIPLH